MWNAFFPQSSSNMRKVLQGHSMSIIGYPIEVLDYYRLFISAKETLQHSMRLRFRRPTWTSIDQRLHPPFISLSFFRSCGTCAWDNIFRDYHSQQFTFRGAYISLLLENFSRNLHLFHNCPDRHPNDQYFLLSFASTSDFIFDLMYIRYI